MESRLIISCLVIVPATDRLPSNSTSPTTNNDFPVFAVVVFIPTILVVDTPTSFENQVPPTPVPAFSTVFHFEVDASY